MLASSLRVSPCNERSRLLSVGRLTVRTESSTSTLNPAGTSISSLPLGPSNRTRRPSIVALTPLSSGTGSFPIRDITSTLINPETAASPGRRLFLPYRQQHFAADFFAPRFAVGHHSQGSRNHVDAKTGANLRHLGASRVASEPGPADPSQPAHHRLPIL